MELTDGKSASFTLVTEEGYRLENITIEIKPEAGSTVSLTLEQDMLSGADVNSGISAQVDQWPSYSNTCRLTVTAGQLLSLIHI